MSLADVASEAHVSAATLSRVERDKQAIGVELFLTLARVLNTAPAELLVDDTPGEEGDGALAVRIAAMQSRERTQLWRQLGDERRESRLRKRADVRTVGAEVEELLAQMDFLRQEIEAVRGRLGRKR
ncbi:MAG TPA: helix-turn-helix transcriptional regulator [Thermoanaerobaculia bacterium]|nr:helix-turn-helix transcriptional regulator [Thermoanaerobaculia bacterium]